MTFEQFVAGAESVIGTRPSIIQGISNIARIMDGLIFLGGPNLERFDGSRRYSFCSRLSFSPSTHFFFCIDFGSFSNALADAVRRLDSTRINNCKMVIDEEGLFISTSVDINTGVYRFNQQSDIRIRAEMFIYHTQGDANSTAEVVNWIKVRFGGTVRKIDSSGNLIHPRLQNSAQHPLNQILYGPPGTGKTYNAINHALAIINGIDVKDLIQEQRTDVSARKRHKDEFDMYVEKGRISLVTFHQSYSYEEFIEGIKPVINKSGEIEYQVVDGVFKKFCNEAGEKKTVDYLPEVDSSEKNFVLIIDEINRGNISKIFGELITLIEESKRIGAQEEIKLKLAYSGIDEDSQDFGVPLNIYLLGTMNSTDRSIALIDTALRRRFSFTEYSPDSSLLPKVDEIDLPNLLDTINARIEYLLDKDHLIGHAYFMNVKSKDDLCAVFRNKIIPLLQEYFYNDFEKIGHVLGDNKLWKKQDDLRIVKEKSQEKIENLFGGEIDGYDGKIIYTIMQALEMKDYKSIDSSVFVSIYEKLSPVSNEINPV